MIDPGLGAAIASQYPFRNGRPGGAIESGPRFDGADEIAAKTTILFSLVAANGLTFSLIHVLIVYGLGAAIAIVHGDHEGHRRGR